MMGAAPFHILSVSFLAPPVRVSAHDKGSQRGWDKVGDKEGDNMGDNSGDARINQTSA